MPLTIWMIECQPDGTRVVVDVVQPRADNGGYWARKMRGWAKDRAIRNPDNTYHLTDGTRREFFKASI